MPTLYSRELPSMLRVADVAAYLNVCTRVAYRIVKQVRAFPWSSWATKIGVFLGMRFLRGSNKNRQHKKLIEARRLRETQGEESAAVVGA